MTGPGVARDGDRAVLGVFGGSTQHRPTAAIEVGGDQLDSLLESARREVVATILRERRSQLEVFTPSELAGLLNVNVKTLDAMGVPRLNLPGRVVRYRMGDVVKWMNQHSA